MPMPTHNRSTEPRRDRKACEALLEDQETHCLSSTRDDDRFCAAHKRQLSESTSAYKQASERANALRNQAVTTKDKGYTLHTVSDLQMGIAITQEYLDARREELRGRIIHSAGFFANEYPGERNGHQMRIERLTNETHKTAEILIQLQGRQRDLLLEEERGREIERRSFEAQRKQRSTAVPAFPRVARSPPPPPSHPFRPIHRRYPEPQYYDDAMPIYTHTGDGSSSGSFFKLAIIILVGYGAYKLLRSGQMPRDVKPPQFSLGVFFRDALQTIGDWTSTRSSAIQTYASDLTETLKPQKEVLEDIGNRLLPQVDAVWTSLSRFVPPVEEMPTISPSLKAEVQTFKDNAVAHVTRWMQEASKAVMEEK